MKCDFCPGEMGIRYRSYSWWRTRGWLSVIYACHKKKCRLALRRFAYAKDKEGAASSTRGQGTDGARRSAKNLSAAAKSPNDIGQPSGQHPTGSR